MEAAALSLLPHSPCQADPVFQPRVSPRVGKEGSRAGRQGAEVLAAVAGPLEDFSRDLRQVAQRLCGSTFPPAKGGSRRCPGSRQGAEVRAVTASRAQGRRRWQHRRKHCTAVLRCRRPGTGLTREKQAGLRKQPPPLSLLHASAGRASGHGKPDRAAACACLLVAGKVAGSPPHALPSGCCLFVKEDTVSQQRKSWSPGVPVEAGPEQPSEAGFEPRRSPSRVPSGARGPSAAQPCRARGTGVRGPGQAGGHRTGPRAGSHAGTESRGCSGKVIRCLKTWRRCEAREVSLLPLRSCSEAKLLRNSPATCPRACRQLREPPLACSSAARAPGPGLCPRQPPRTFPPASAASKRPQKNSCLFLFFESTGPFLPPKRQWDEK